MSEQQGGGVSLSARASDSQVHIEIRVDRGTWHVSPGGLAGEVWDAVRGILDVTARRVR